MSETCLSSNIFSMNILFEYWIHILSIINISSCNISNIICAKYRILCSPISHRALLLFALTSNTPWGSKLESRISIRRYSLTEIHVFMSLYDTVQLYAKFVQIKCQSWNSGRKRITYNFASGSYIKYCWTSFYNFTRNNMHEYYFEIVY